MTQNIKKTIIEHINKCPNKRIPLINLRKLCGNPKSQSNQVLDELLEKGELVMYRNSTQDVAVLDPTLPTYQTKHSVGADVPCLDDVVIPAGAQVLIPTTLLVKDTIGLSQIAMLTARSSFFSIPKERKLLLTNGVGTIDPDYPDNVAFSYINLGDKDVKLEKGTSVGQVVVFDVDVSKFPTLLAERTGGWGHTDKAKEK